MRLRAITGTPESVAADVLAVPIYRDDADLTGDLGALDAASGGAIRAAIEWGEFNPVETRVRARGRRQPSGRAPAAAQRRGAWPGGVPRPAPRRGGHAPPERPRRANAGDLAA